MKICNQDKKKVLEAIHQGNIDAVAGGYDNLIDDIVLHMKQQGVLAMLGEVWEDKRDTNRSIPSPLLLTLCVAAKMKLKTRVSDIPFAITDTKTLAELGYNLVDTEHGLEKGLMTEGAVRHLVNQYPSAPKPDDPYSHPFMDIYNNYVQKHVMPTRHMSPNIHILDCTKLEASLDNDHYELSDVVKDKDGVYRGYKMGNLRGITGDIGIMEEAIMGNIKTHDLKLCRPMLLTTPVLKPGDFLLNDRGFLDRETTNLLKINRGVDTFIPVKKNMDIYKMAVSTAIHNNEWQAHPNKKRKFQTIAFVRDLGDFWQSDDLEQDQKVPLNACVVRESHPGTDIEDAYWVFVTTHLSSSAKAIIQTYELRPEIEEDYRQIKDFWKLEDFKSTKYNFVVFHIVLVLLGYLFFQVFKTLDGNEKYHQKSLPVLLKNYVPKRKPPMIVVYAGTSFGIFALLELMDLYVSLSEEIRSQLRPFLK